MKYNLGLGVSNLGNAGRRQGTSGSAGSKYGRVVDIIYDAFHPKYEDYGKSQSINGIFYREISAPSSEDEDLKFAYCSKSNVKVMPLLGEIVVLIERPTEQRTTDPNATKVYWDEIVAIWNHPHHNAYPDTNQTQDSTNDFGKEFEELGSIAPLQVFPGDLLLESRHGSSMRFGGTKYESNELSDESNNGKPYTIIRNGQKEGGKGTDPVLETVNEDKSSIYLTSDHTIDLEQANIKRDAWSEEPEEANKFKGAQVIINSGRLYFNAYDEHALFSAKEGIGLNAKTVSLDGEEYVGLDAKKIYLGVAALKREQEPVLKGETTALWLEDWLSQFEQLVKGMATAPPSPPVFVAKIIALCNAILPIIPILKNRIPNLKSKKVFTE